LKASDTENATVERATALRIIGGLRTGATPFDGVGAFSAGRERLVEGAEEQFAEIEVSDDSRVRWIKGLPEQGKTNFFARLIESASKRNWVSSYIALSARDSGTELHRFEEIYRAIVTHCRCPHEALDKASTHGQRLGWDLILDQWWEKMRRLAGGATGVSSFALRDQIEHAITSMRLQWGMHNAFAGALREFAISREDGEEGWTETMRSWFRAGDEHSRGGVVKARLLAAGIREPINRRNAKEMLRSFSIFIRVCGYAGTLILIDELENVPRHEPAGARKTAYTVLRELIDDVDGKHGMVRTAFYIAATPDVFDNSEKGILEHEALATRVLGITDHGDNPVAPLIDLASWPLTRDDLIKIGLKVLRIHGVARNWNPGDGDDQRISALLHELLRKNPDLTVRAWVKNVVADLDRRSAQPRT